MNATPLRRRLRVVFFVVGIALLAAGLATPSPASAATCEQGLFQSDAYGKFTVDTDGFSYDSPYQHVGGNPCGGGSASAVSYHDGSRTRAEITGYATGKMDQFGHWTDCGIIQFAFAYSDGSTSVERRDLRCGTTTWFDIDSAGGKDLVRWTFTGQKYFCDPGPDRLCQYWEEHPVWDSPQALYVGDSPDSTGTASQLDKDDLSSGPYDNADNRETFSGSTTWFLRPDAAPNNAVLSHVKGTLAYNSSVGSARLKISWTFAEGDPTVWTSPAVDRTHTTLGIDQTSPLVWINEYNQGLGAHHARYVHVEIERLGPAGWYGLTDTMSKFGDA
jgi:hypothetical protein